MAVTTRQAHWLLIGWLISFSLTITVALYLTWNNRTKPSPFVPPAIWHELFTGGEVPIPEFDI